MTKVINCECGFRIEGDSDDELWTKAQEHIKTAHAEMVGKVTREEILAQAEPA